LIPTAATIDPQKAVTLSPGFVCKKIEYELSCECKIFEKNAKAVSKIDFYLIYSSGIIAGVKQQIVQFSSYPPVIHNPTKCHSIRRATLLDLLSASGERF
jgi:hypothetical protein